MGLFSIDKSKYSKLEELCVKAEETMIAYAKLGEECGVTEKAMNEQARAVAKTVKKFRAQMARGTMPGFSVQSNMLNLIQFIAPVQTLITLFAETPEQIAERVAKLDPTTGTDFYGV